VAETDEEAYGVTIPLLLTSSGEKFGKSAGNAVWLDNNLTSFYDFYQARQSINFHSSLRPSHIIAQFFLRVEDAEVSSYLRKFTLLPIEQIENIVTEHMVPSALFKLKAGFLKKI
jgi:tyrosyl-tRNA synthetase